ncbi:MAG: hypothetical protein ACK5LY_06605 [Lachnospirales bacterium]
MDKIRKNIWLQKDTLIRCENGMKIDNSKFLNEFLENAVEYYSAYLNSINNQDIVSEIFVNVLDGRLGQAEDRLSKLIFKVAVEQAKTSHILAHMAEVDDDTLKGLHLRCINDVKKTNGRITFEDTFKFQKGLE